MTFQRFKELYEAQPFRPFTMHLADGREIPVVSRELVASAPTGQTIAVFQPNDTLSIIDLLQVTDIEVTNPPTD